MDTTVTLYEVQDRDGNTVGDLWTRDDYGPAKREAQEVGGYLVEHTYKWVDSEEVEDFRPKCKDCDGVLSEHDEEEYDDQCADCYNLENNPQPEDLFTEDDRHFYQVGDPGHRCVVTVPDGEEAGDYIRAWMKRENFYPNVWSISDHGNACLYSY